MSKEEARPHLLLVEDARDIREPLARYLREHEFRVTTAADASVARHVMKSAAIDLIVLDIMMPGEDGVSLCRSVWETSQVPVILLTARGDEPDRVLGLEMGAADYVAKPFAPRELLARINAVLRRTRAMPPYAGLPPGSRIRFGDWSLDTELRLLLRGDEKTALTVGEYRLLSALLGRPRVALTRAQLIDYLGLSDDAQSGRSIDNYVSRLRKKLEADPAKPVFIKTLWGGGYIFAVEPVHDTGAADTGS